MNNSYIILEDGSLGLRVAKESAYVHAGNSYLLLQADGSFKYEMVGEVLTQTFIDGQYYTITTIAKKTTETKASTMYKAKAKVKKYYKVYIWDLNSDDSYTLTTNGIKLDEKETDSLIIKYSNGSNPLNYDKLVYAKRLGNAKYASHDKYNCYQARMKYKHMIALNPKNNAYQVPPKATPNKYVWTDPDKIVLEDKYKDEPKNWLLCKLSCGSFPAKSQKIKGLGKASKYIKQVTSAYQIDEAYVAIEETNQDITHNCYKSRVSISQVLNLMVGKFVRPCPKVPRHGFVDSRVIVDRAAARTILREIKEAGESPELIIMDKVNCDYSAVVTPDMVTFGKSNDGATQGHDAVEIKFNIGPSEREQLLKKFWTSPDWPFVELLYTKELLPELVQLRAGPVLTAESKSVRVTEVYKVDDKMELLEWAKVVALLRAKTLIGSDGMQESVAVWHSGGALGSHFGVWCLDSSINNPTIPYVTSEDKPVIGSVIEIGKKHATKLSALKEGLLLGLDAPIKDMNSANNDLSNFLGAFHMYSLADLGDEVTARYIGYSWAIGVRVISALPFGECFHRETSREAHGKLLGKHLSGERDYTKVWCKDMDTILEGLNLARGFFDTLSWGMSYGGPKWSSCTQTLIMSFNKIRAFLNLTSNDNLSELVTALNIMVNEVHNGGWWLNKLSVTKAMFDLASHLPHFALRPNRALEIKGMKLGLFQGKLKTAQQVKMLAKAKVSYSKEETKIIEVKAKAAEMYKVANEVDESPTVIAVDNCEAVSKIVNSVIGQFTVASGHIHIQVASKEYVNRDYGYAVNILLEESICHMVEKEFYCNKSDGILKQSLTKSGNMYAPLMIKTCGDIVYLIFVGPTVLQIEDKGLAKVVGMLVDGVWHDKYKAKDTMDKPESNTFEDLVVETTPMPTWNDCMTCGLYTENINGICNDCTEW